MTNDQTRIVSDLRSWGARRPEWMPAAVHADLCRVTGRKAMPLRHENRFMWIALDALSRGQRRADLVARDVRDGASFYDEIAGKA